MMHLRNYLLILQLTVSLSCFAQVQTAEFETTFYFEDALGNRDTIIAGMDTTANNSYNPHLGEVAIDAPFDSIFEVRAVKKLSLQYGAHPVMSKKAICKASPYVIGPNCYASNGVIFLINARYQPVTITWDASDFDDYCLAGSYLTDNKFSDVVLMESLVGLGSDAFWFDCLPGNQQTQITLHGWAPEFVYYYAYQLEYYIEGNTTKDTIYGVKAEFGWKHPWSSPCFFVISSNEPEQEGASPLAVWPNPAADHLQVKLPTLEGQLYMTNFTGQLVGETIVAATDEHYDWHLPDLPSGLYCLFYKASDGRIWATKVMLKGS